MFSKERKCTVMNHNLYVI